MAKTKDTTFEPEGDGKKVSARCHCPVCGKTYVMDVMISGIPKKGCNTLTACRVCKKSEDKKTVTLIFDRKY